MVSVKEISEKLKSEGKYWITFIGDSITSCEWVHPNWREIVEYVLKNEVGKDSSDWMSSSWGIRCFNFGLDGATSKDIVERLTDIKKTPVDLAFLMIGANDVHNKLSPEDHKRNVETIIESYRKSNIPLVFSTNNKPWNKKAEEEYEPCVKVDKSIDADKFINLFEMSSSFPSDRIYTFKFEEYEDEGIKAGDTDFWHPNQLGNTYIAKVILKEVFSIDFDPELYWKTTLAGEKYPEY